MNCQSARRCKPGGLLVLVLAAWCTLALTSVSGLARSAQGKPGPPGQQNQGEKQAQTKLETEPQLVYLNAVVRDKKGRTASSLNKEDFSIDEDGRPQMISSFARASELPLTIGLLVDTTMSQRAVLNSERDASYKFLDEMLREGKDKAFLIHFDREVELLRDLTADRSKLKSALDKLQVTNYERASDSDRDDEDDDSSGRQRHGDRQLYDAVYLASNELLKKQPGRKALFLLSDGVDRGSKESLEDAMESAQRANASVYSIYYASEEPREHEGGGHHGGWHVGMGGPGVGYPGGGYPGGGSPGGGGQRTREPRVDGRKVLERISAETGGRLFEVSKKLTIGDIYAQAQEDLKNQYSLAYTPDRPAHASADDYHRIHLTTKQSDLTVQTRAGYYSD